MPIFAKKRPEAKAAVAKAVVDLAKSVKSGKHDADESWLSREAKAQEEKTAGKEVWTLSMGADAGVHA